MRAAKSTAVKAGEDYAPEEVVAAPEAMSRRRRLDPSSDETSTASVEIVAALQTSDHASFEVTDDENPPSSAQRLRSVPESRSIDGFEAGGLGSANRRQDKRTPKDRCVMFIKNHKYLTVVFAVLFVTGVIVGVAVFTSSGTPSQPTEENGGDDDGNATTTISSPPTPSTTGSSTRFSSIPSPAPTVSFGCFTKTADILKAQQQTPDHPSVYTICPDARVNIGTFANLANNDFRYFDGDASLHVLHSNILIQCGADGDPDNNCVLDGGFVQVLIQTFLPMTDLGGLIITEALENVTIRGLTFTGSIQDSSPSFNGLSVLLSHPGTVTFEDCRWINMTAPTGLVGVYQNGFQQLTGKVNPGDRTMHAIFTRCEFNNIVLDTPMFLIERQNVTLSDVRIENVVLANDARQQCWFSRVEPMSFFLEDGCSGLLYCRLGAVCTVSSLCVERFESSGPSLMLFTNDTNWSVTNSAVVVNQNASQDTSTCAVAIAGVVDDSWRYECIEEAIVGTPATCQLSANQELII